MTEDEIRSIAKEAGTESANEVLARLGIDTSDPWEVQKDHHFLRGLRKNVSSVWLRVLTVSAGVIVVAVLASLAKGSWPKP
jgi:hypothetical protein